MDCPVQKEIGIFITFIIIIIRVYITAAGTNLTELLFRQRVTATIRNKALAVSDNGRCVCRTAAVYATLSPASFYKPHWMMIYI